MQQSRQRTVARTVGIHDLFRAAHIRGDMRIDLKRVFTAFTTHRTAEFEAVKLGDMAR
ncbi:hypothetical protein D3C78_1884840 [compost metagenome]